MQLQVHEFRIPINSSNVSLLHYFRSGVKELLAHGSFPLRFVVTRTDGSDYHCEVGVLVADASEMMPNVPSPFAFARRCVENTQQFNAVLIVPTGIGAEIGGHAGDATSVARVLANACDALVTHPNVVNASDINELPENGLYVEGSLLCRLLMGTIGLQRVRANRVLVVVEKHEEERIVHDVINAVNAASAVYGLRCVGVEVLKPSFTLNTSYTTSGAAAGCVQGLERLVQVLDSRRRDFDSVAVSSLINICPESLVNYFCANGEVVNPWGGVEAMLTHAISSMYDIPAAHAPMMESMEIANLDLGVVDPRKAAEAASLAFLNCVLKGLQKSPRVVVDQSAMQHPAVITAADISCVIIPDGCLGLPTIAAFQQGIPVIAVKENRNVMQNDLSALNWAEGQFYLVENYWEAAGVMLALKAGIDPGSVRRPILKSMVTSAVHEPVIEG